MSDYGTNSAARRTVTRFEILLEDLRRYGASPGEVLAARDSALRAAAAGGSDAASVLGSIVSRYLEFGRIPAWALERFDGPGSAVREVRGRA